MHTDVNRGPFVTGQCLRCGFEAIGGICADCLAELADFIEGADLTGLARWANAWPGGAGAPLAAPPPPPPAPPAPRRP